MSMIKLVPACKDYIWGGQRLMEEYGKEFDGDCLAETWELSCHKDGESKVVGDHGQILGLNEYIEQEGKQILGTNCQKFQDFPVLIKLIDAKRDLSIQVHPDDEYAWEHEGQSGKTETWYVADSEENSFIYYGFSRKISKEEFEMRIKNDTLLEVLNRVPVKKGDCFFLEAGTIHAIGNGCLMAEIQQNSNLTYRVYDYNRPGADGKPRALHIDKALQVTRREPVIQKQSHGSQVACCRYFSVSSLILDGVERKEMSGLVDERSFLHILILDGEGTISDHGRQMDFRKGDSILLLAGTGAYRMEGVCTALLTHVPDPEHVG